VACRPGENQEPDLVCDEVMKTEEAEPAEQQNHEEKSRKGSDKSNELAAENNQETAEVKEAGGETEDAEKGEDHSQEKSVPAASEKHENKKESKPIKPNQDAKRHAA
jgi:hypothetical protein